MTMDDGLKCNFLLCILPNLWDTFCIVVSNSAQNGKLVYNDKYGVLLSKEICKKSMTTSHSGDAYNVYELGSSKNQQCGRSETRNNSTNDRVRSKSIKKKWSVIMAIRRDTSRKIVMP